jgi:uncharacterized protein YdeI (YjbR/CyaY-like superfamily)
MVRTTPLEKTKVPDSGVPENSVQAETRQQWRAWLEQHHPQKDGVWLVLWKKSNGRAQLSYDEAVEEALAQTPTATAYFEAFPRSVKRNILEWIGNAKTPATRSKRIEETARLAAVIERANQWRK